MTSFIPPQEAVVTCHAECHTTTKSHRMICKMSSYATKKSQHMICRMSHDYKMASYAM